MKNRYFAFCGMNYYPHGGMEDFIGAYESVNKAGLAIGKFIKKDNNSTLEKAINIYWYHVWDMENMKMVLQDGDDISEPQILALEE